MKYTLVEVQQEEIKHSNSLFKAISRSKLQISSVDKIKTSSFHNIVSNTPNYFQQKKLSKPEIFDQLSKPKHERDPRYGPMS